MTSIQIRKLGPATVAFMALMIGILVGFYAILFYASRAADLKGFFSIVGTGLLVAGGSFVIGGLLGFLFGIPRTLQAQQSEQTYISSFQSESLHDDTKSGEERKNNQGLDNGKAAYYQANTNLEQISDWLTKILVGVGLTQLTKMPTFFVELGNQLSPAFGNFESSATFSVAVFVFFIVCGFLIFYLWTRLYMAGELKRADLGSELSEVRSRMQRIEEQNLKDASALGAVQQMLNPPEGIHGISESELISKIKAASSQVKAQIFYQARIVRTENWKREATKYKMERTIPIFRALITSDEEDKYYANYGQLGFALKDKRKPDYQGAERVLSRAIEIRGSWKRQGWVSYEFVRAICRIHMDPNFQNHSASGSEDRQKIFDDLSVAAKSQDVQGWFLDTPEIIEWMDLNRITMDDL